MEAFHRVGSVDDDTHMETDRGVGIRRYVYIGIADGPR